MQNKKDYLFGTDLVITQHPQMFRMNTDSKLLGQFMKIKKNDRVHATVSSPAYMLDEWHLCSRNTEAEAQSSVTSVIHRPKS